MTFSIREIIAYMREQSKKVGGGVVLLPDEISELLSVMDAMAVIVFERTEDLVQAAQSHRQIELFQSEHNAYMAACASADIDPNSDVLNLWEPVGEEVRKSDV